MAMAALSRRRFQISVEPWTGFEPAQGGVCVMLWAHERYTRLVEAHQLRDDVALADWLTGVVARYGRENLSVDWTESLRQRKKLALTVARCLEVSIPRSA